MKLNYCTNKTQRIMRQKKRFNFSSHYFMLALSALLFFSLYFSFAHSNALDSHQLTTDYTTVINGEIKEITTPLIIQRNTIMVPVREFAQLLGIDINNHGLTWSKNESSLELLNVDIYAKIYNNRRIAIKNGQYFHLNHIPFIYDGALYIAFNDLAYIFDKISILSNELKVLSIVDREIYFQNKYILGKIKNTLNSQEKMDVEIKFDFEEEVLNFDFKVDNINQIVNGKLIVDKYFNNRYVKEKAEIFANENNFFIKDYTINKWRLDESGSFNVISSFLRVFSSSHMLNFDPIAYSTFVLRDSPRGYIFQNNVIYNEYLKYDLGFHRGDNFYFRMNVNKNTYEIINLVVQNTEFVEQEILTSRLDVFFWEYGDKVSFNLPAPHEFAQRNVTDIQNANAIKKALILFLFDAQLDANYILSKINTVDELLEMLQNIITLDSREQSISYGPYLANLSEKDLKIETYKPVQQEKQALNITVDIQRKNVQVEFSHEDKLTIIE